MGIAKRTIVPTAAKVYTATPQAPTKAENRMNVMTPRRRSIDPSLPVAATGKPIGTGTKRSWPAAVRTSLKNSPTAAPLASPAESAEGKDAGSCGAALLSAGDGGDAAGER